MTKYVASVNIPGYLPEGDTLVFDSPGEAWAYLADERREAEDAMYEPGQPDGFSDVVTRLENTAESAGKAEPGKWDVWVGTVYGGTPGCTAQQAIHDLGRAYAVSAVSDAEAAEIEAMQD